MVYWNIESRNEGVSTISYHCYDLKLQKNLPLVHKEDHRKLYHGFERGSIGLSKAMLG